MRLIDAERLIKAAEQYVDTKEMISAPDMKEILGVEVIDAIPIEFIKEKIADNQYIWGFASPKTAKYYENSVRALESLIWEWEKNRGNFTPKDVK